MKSEKHEELFVQLITMFQFAALQHMGKLKNPVTDAVEQDLAQAQFAIDMLEMLQVKMRGNLSPEEEKMIGALLHDLRLNYVDEVNKVQAAQPKP
jgi:hypothetical protein